MDSQLYQRVALTASKGVWLADPGDSKVIPDGYVRAATDFDFFSGVAVSRKGFADVDISADSVGLVSYKALTLANQDFFGVPIDHLYLVIGGADGYKRIAYNPINDTYTAFTLTGPNFAAGEHTDNSWAVVNGQTVAAGVGGMDYNKLALPGTDTYTAVAGQAWTYLLGHKSRLLLAANPNIANGLLTVKWTVPGTVDNFAGFGSGAVVLAEAPDTIQGLFLVRDSVVVIRAGGIVIGEPTGQADPPFNWRTLWMKSGGVRYPRTVCQHMDLLFWVGEDNIYMTDLVKVQAIGSAVAPALFRDLEPVGTEFPCRATLIRSSMNSYRKQYVISRVQEANHKMYVYDLDADTWAVYTFSDTIAYQGASRFRPITGHDHLIYIDNNRHLRVMKSNLECEKSPTLSWPSLGLTPQKNDARVIRAYLRCSLVGAGGVVTLNVKCKRGAPNSTLEENFTVASSGQASSTQADRFVFNMDMVGNEWVFTLTFPAGNRVIFEELLIEFADGGEVR